MRIFVASALLITAFQTEAHSDQLSNANVRNAAELTAYGILCKTTEAREMAAAYNRMAGRPNDVHATTADRVRTVKASGKVKSFCRQTRVNLPNFAQGLELNSPSEDRTVPSAVITRAEADCSAVVPVRITKEMSDLYSTCVEQQVQFWRIQERYN